MTQTSIILFSLLIAAGTFLAGYLFRESRRRPSGFLILSGFIILLLTGLMIVVDPLTFRNGESEFTTYEYDVNATGQNDNILSTNKTVTYQYSEQSTSLNGALAMILLLVGLFGSWETSKRMYSERTDKNSGFKWEGDDF